MKKILVLIILLFFISLIMNQMCCEYITPVNKTTEHINTLIRQAARWSAAAQQDESPIIALLHANYGAGYLWALKDIASDKEIEDASGIDVLKFKKTITDVQDQSTQKVSNLCPEFVGDINEYLLELAGNK